MKQITNMRYDGDRLVYVTPDGNVNYTNFLELMLPYYYSRENIKDKRIVHTEVEKINVLYPAREQEEYWFKNYVETPIDVKGTKLTALSTCEADIEYLERRIGADKIIQWTKPEHIGYLDIETLNNKISLIGITDEHEHYEYFFDVESAVNYIEQKRMAMVTGWNSSAYDYKFIDGATDNAYWKTVLKQDSMILYSKFLQKHRRGLNFIAKENGLGEKSEIDFKYATRKQLRDYNEYDCLLLKKISDMFGLFDISFEVAQLTGVHPSIYSQSMFWEGYVMSHRSEYNVWLLDKPAYSEHKDYEGATIYSKARGVYENTGDLDFSSLYPNAFMRLKKFGTSEAAVRLVMKTMRDFLDNKGRYDKLWKEMKLPKYFAMRYAQKILANGSYGLFGMEFFRYYDVDVAAAVTADARLMLQELQNNIRSLNFDVIYSDTDSSFVPNITKEQAVKLEAEINKRIAPFEVKLDSYFARIFFPATDDKHVRKRYAGITDEGEKIVKGFEMIRGDWSDKARVVQEHIFDIIYTAPLDRIESDIRDYMKEVYSDFMLRRFDVRELLKTQTVKGDKEYKNDNLPQLRALRAAGIQNAPVMFVSYWIDRKGEAIPLTDNTDLEEVARRIDWKSYYEKQIKVPTDRILASFKTPTKQLIFD